jgi:rRNA maturation RNase YbeY
LGKISFKNNGISAGIKKPKELKRFLASIFTSEGYEFKEVSYIFCSDKYLSALNQKYLSHDSLTDIITFTLSGVSMPIISDIYISIERVRENASLYDAPYVEELYRVMIHGVLHLCGYSDHSPELKKDMKKMEEFYLKNIGFT